MPFKESDQQQELEIRASLFLKLAQIVFKNYEAWYNDKLPSPSTHCLRHTFASHYLVAHLGDLVSLARLLGHSLLDTTKIYVQPTKEQFAKERG